MELRFIEVFESWQGEGPSQGRRAMFYRVAGCNLKCKWCDTKYTWFGEEEIEYRDPERGMKLVVITGGEPLWGENREKVIKLLTKLNEWAVSQGYDIEVEIETNGTQVKFPEEVFVMFSNISKLRYIVSPKKEGGLDSSWLSPVEGREEVVFKVVVGDEEDEEWLRSLIDVFDKVGVSRDRVWVMSRGTSVKELLSNGKRVIKVAEEYMLNVSLRLHIFFSVK